MKKAKLLSALVLFLGLLFILNQSDAKAQTSFFIERVSVSSDGTEALGSSGLASISGDGRYVIFRSNADNLVADDGRDWDIFLHDRETSETSLVSVSSIGYQCRSSAWPSMSEDGRYITFDTTRPCLPNGRDGNHGLDVFVHDTQTGETSRISVKSGGGQAFAGSVGGVLSGDGRYVAFQSYSSNLVKDDTNGHLDIFVHDRILTETKRVSVSSQGDQGNGRSFGNPDISYDGRLIVFKSEASNLVSDDTNGVADIFVHDQHTGETARVSVSSDNVQANAASEWPASISSDGRFVAFQSLASNLVSGDTNGARDAFVRDLENRKTKRISVSSSGAQGDGYSGFPSLSGDGRYVGFHSIAGNLVENDTNRRPDAFIFDQATETTTRISVAADGSEARGWGHLWGSGGVSVSADGRFASFVSDAINLVEGDANYNTDVFVTLVQEQDIEGIFLDLEIPSQLQLNQDGWYEESPFQAKASIENNSEELFAGKLVFSISNSSRLVSESEGEVMIRPSRFESDVVVESSEIAEVSWPIWVRPMSEDAVIFTGELLDNNGELVVQKSATMLVPTAQIHPVVVIPGLMGSMRDSSGQWKIDPIAGTYDNLLEEFKLAGYEEDISLFTFPYDWRKNISQSGNDLGEAIKVYLEKAVGGLDRGKDYIDTSSVDIVSHSLGGLVSRAYIQGDSYDSDVHRLVTLGTPHLGAPKAYLAAEGLEFDFLDDTLGKGGKFFAERLLRSLAQKNNYCTNFGTICSATKRDLYNYIYEEVPSIREIFPVDDYLKDDPGGYLVDANDSTKIFPFGRQENSFLTSLNSDVEKLINRLGVDGIIPVVGERPRSDSDRYYRIFEQSLIDRVYGLWNNGKVSKDEKYRIQGKGDITVPSDSANLSLLDDRIKSEIKLSSDREEIFEHGNMPSHLQQSIIEYLSDSRPFFDSGFEDTKFDWRGSLLFFNLSPVEIQVADPLGRKSGIDFDTEEELAQIPGAIFSRSNELNEPDFILIPNALDGEYNIMLKGTDDGNYRVLMEAISEEGVITINELFGDTTIGEYHEHTLTYDQDSLPILPLNIEWHPPLSDGEQIINVSHKRTIPIKFTIRDAHGKFVLDENAFVWITDSDNPSKVIAFFKTNEGNKHGQSDSLRIDIDKEQYIANFHLKDYYIKEDHVYIIRTRIFSEEIGSRLMRIDSDIKRKKK